MDPKEATQLVTDLYRSAYSMLLRYAIRTSGNLVMAEDLVQEAFMLLYRELRRDRPVGNPKAWMFCVIRRLVSKEIVRRQRTGDLHEPLSALDEFPAYCEQEDLWATPDEVTKLFSVLTRREEEVTLLRMAALKYREIADHLGISPKSVGTLLTRAIQKMQKAAGTKPPQVAEMDYVETTYPKTSG